MPTSEWLGEIEGLTSEDRLADVDVDAQALAEMLPDAVLLVQSDVDGGADADVLSEADALALKDADKVAQDDGEAVWLTIIDTVELGQALIEIESVDETHAQCEGEALAHALAEAEDDALPDTLSDDDNDGVNDTEPDAQREALVELEMDTEGVTVGQPVTDALKQLDTDALVDDDAL